MRAKLVAAVILIMACFAFNSVATRLLVNRALLDAASVTIVRFASGAAMLAIVLAGQGRARDAVPDRRDAVAVLFLGAYALAIAYGYRSITAAAGTFVFYALVIATMTLAGRARPSPAAVAGALVALVGVGVLAIGRVAGTSALGIALLAITGAAWGAYSLTLRARGDPVRTNARAFLGFTFLLPILALVEWRAIHVTPIGLLLAAFMGAITTALSYALWARVLPELKPVEAGTFQLLVPILTAATGVVALGEPMTPQLAIAAALVLSGMAITVAAGRPRPSAPARG